MKFGVVCGLLLASAFAVAQTPDAIIKADLRLTYRAPRNEKQTFRWYDAFGDYSTLSLLLTLEPGFRLKVSERLQKIDGNSDPDQLDEAYIEDPGLWKVGKQYLPIGRGMILQESAIAASGETNFLIGGLPVLAAVFDGGDGRARGVAGRVGSRIGVSVAVGQFLGAQSSSLTVLREPEDGPGYGRGYRFIAGVDFNRRLGKQWQLQGEAMVFRRGQTKKDLDADVSDLVLSYEPTRDATVSLGWSREWRDEVNFLRAQAAIPIYRKVWIEPFARVRNGTIFDGGISLRVRF